MAVILTKYKLVCEVTIGEEKVGYIADKEQFEKSIETIIDAEEENKVETKLVAMPVCNLVLVDKSKETNDKEILAKVKDSSETTYKLYAVTINGKENVKLANLKEAEELVKELSDKYEKKLNMQIGIVEYYTTNKEENLTEINVAKAGITKELSAQEAKLSSAKTTTNKTTTKKTTTSSTTKTKSTTTKTTTSSKPVSLNGVTLSVTPVSGIITSRFGSRESIRSSGHTGLDIAAPKGTPIKAAASGTVTFAGTSGGYGKLVKISHGNGIVTYYGHCSKINVSNGDEVKAGDVIAEVGSTGNSTGNHLHFEIQKNGTRLNPQNYLYKGK